MAKKQYLESDFYEGYSLLSIVCGLPDYRLAHYINLHAQIELQKFDDFIFDRQAAFSWYSYTDQEQRRSYFLMQNKKDENLLLPSLRRFDYLLLLYGNFIPLYLNDLMANLRTIPYVTAVFAYPLLHVKKGDMLIQQNELHATRQRQYIENKAVIL
jgi:hypothetical protein